MVGRARANDDRGFALRLANETAAVETARQALLEYLARFELEAKIVNRIEVLAEELISNVVRHSKSATCVAIEAECSKGTVSLAVSDDGAAFNPLERPEPAPFSTLDDAPLGGLGIPLIKRLTKSVSYSRTGEHNRIDLTVSAD